MTTIAIVIGILILWYAERSYIIYRKYGFNGWIKYLTIEWKLTQGDLSFVSDKEKTTTL